MSRAPDAQPAASDAAYEQGVAKLERELAFARRNGSLALRQLHATMVREVRTAEGSLRRARRRGANLRRRLAEAERKAARATARAERAERELAELRGSATWRAGSAVLAVPRRVRGLRRSNGA